MNPSEKSKRFKRAIARQGLFASSWFLNLLPYRVVRALTRIFIFIGYIFTVSQKRIAFESLRIAFGKEKSDQEIRGISRDCFRNLGKGMIELIYFMDHPKMIREHVEFEGKEHLDKAFAQGKGVVAISAHFGSFPLMLLRCAQEGYKANAIIRPARDEIIEKYFLSQRSKLGLNTVYSHPRKQCVDTSIRVLRGNELLFIPLDQNFGSGGGVFVEFFGQKAATATGPVVFARRTGAPLIPMFIVRQGDDRHKIIIEPPMNIEEKATDQETIEFNTAKITALIERYVRKYPQEWGWMHRRWKSRPPGENDLT
jgi:KDO2-lipid IV(A) lauroyltransferase